MLSVVWNASLCRRSSLVATCLALIVITQLTGAGKSPMRVLKYDPAAEKIALFDGLESKTLSVRVTADDVKGGHLYIENLSKKPVTVELPEALVMVHVLKQAGNGFFSGLGNNNAFGSNGGQFGMTGGQMGGGQSIGAGFGQQQGMSSGFSSNFGNGQNQVGNGMNQVGNGLFSIPPERVVEVPYKSVCLNYGKADPSPRMTYRPVQLEVFSRDKVLHATLRKFGRGELSQGATQAAAWHLSSKLTWERLASLTENTLPGVDWSQAPTFSESDLNSAHELVSTVTKQVAAETKPEAPTKPVSRSTRAKAVSAKKNVKK